MKANSSPFDFIIIGGGLSGLQLAKALLDEGFLEECSLAIFESRSDQIQNDKTWSFWEKGTGKWDKIVSHQWNKACFVDEINHAKDFDLAPYVYKTIQSKDFYQHLIHELQACKNFHWINDQVDGLTLGSEILVKTTNNHSYLGKRVFDSRPPQNLEDAKYPMVWQHFKGYVVESDKALFDEEQIRMMDFSLTDGVSCSFTYVLPYSKTKALVEFTYFSKDIVDEKVYDDYIKKYLNHIGCSHYEVKETEMGKIPMSSYPFHKHNTENYLKIGTAGGWVKASSGYSFKNTEHYIQKVIGLLKENRSFKNLKTSSKYQWYDELFLSVLAHENHKGAKLFGQMYGQNSIQEIFAFLDEQSALFQELKIISSFEKAPFLRALKRKYLG